MSMQRLKFAIFLTLSIFSLSFCFAESNYVLRIKASNCNYNASRGKTNFSTGFVLKFNDGVQRIVTTLHGVCGCSSISAENNNGKKFFSLTISHADIDNDVAILYSEKVADYYNSGLESNHISPTLLADKNVKMLSYPFGINLLLDTELARVRKSPSVKLNRFIRPRYKEALEIRGSPNVDINVLNLETEIVSGSSGSPILYDGKVIGIANGGLAGGASHVCWAIPIKNIKFNSVGSLGEEYRKLEDKNPNNLFLLTCNIESFATSLEKPKISSTSKCYVNEQKTTRGYGPKGRMVYDKCKLLFQITEKERKKFGKALVITNGKNTFEITFRKSSREGFYYSDNVTLGCGDENCSFDYQLKFRDKFGYEESTPQDHLNDEKGILSRENDWVPEIRNYFKMPRLDPSKIRTLQGNGN